MIGLARSLATAGAAHGIEVNLLAPAATTRMAGSAPGAPEMAPDLVAPMAAFLAYEDCPVSGEIYAAGAGSFARIFLATTPGYVHPGSGPDPRPGPGPGPTIEDAAGNWAEINDDKSWSAPADLMSWSAGFLAHLR